MAVSFMTLATSAECDILAMVPLLLMLWLLLCSVRCAGDAGETAAAAAAAASSADCRLSGSDRVETIMVGAIICDVGIGSVGALWLFVVVVAAVVGCLLYDDDGGRSLLCDDCCCLDDRYLPTLPKEASLKRGAITGEGLSEADICGPTGEAGGTDGCTVDTFVALSESATPLVKPFGCK